MAANSHSTTPSKPAKQPSTAMVVELIELDGHGDAASSANRPASSTSPSQAENNQRTPVAPASFIGPDAGRVAQSAPSNPDQIAALPEDGGGIASSSSAAADLSDYQRRLHEIVARHSRYPGEAKQLRLAGITHLAFRLDRNGNVLESWVHRSSGSALLDNAALLALQKSRPLPPIPASLPARMDFVIEIDSSLQQVAFQTAN